MKFARNTALPSDAAGTAAMNSTHAQSSCRLCKVMRQLEGQVVNRLKLVFLLCGLLVPLSVHANALCNGFKGAYADELISLLEANSNWLSSKLDPTRKHRVASLKSLLRANERIGKTAGFVQRVFICFQGGLNAFVTTKAEPIRVNSDTVDLIGKSEDAMAAILGHEYSHLALNHVGARIVAARAASHRAGRIAVRNTRTWEDGRAVALKSLAEEMSAFSVRQELEADDHGISLLAKAGYKPTGFLTVQSVGLALYGDEIAQAFPTHPGFMERLAKGESRVTDESFDQVAAGLKSAENFDALSALVSDWMSRLPDSGNARYYRAILLRQGKERAALEAMEDAFNTARKPGITQRVGETNAAWLWLCTELYRQGYTFESAWCGDTLKRLDEQLWTRFQLATFQGNIWVGAMNVEGDRTSALYLSFVRKPDGTKYISNSKGTATSYGLEAEVETPAWRPIRFKPCDKSKVRACPRDDLDESLAVRGASEDPLQSVRAECKPPRCLVTR